MALRKSNPIFAQMNNKMKSLIIAVLISLAFFSCSKQQCVDTPDISSIKVNMKLVRLDQQVRQAKTRAELKKIIDSNPVFAEEFLGKSQYPADSILVNRYFELLQEPSIDTLFTQTEAAYGDFSAELDDFARAFKIIKYYYPNFKAPTIKTAVTGLSYDMYISDSLIIVGLDYYLGKQAKYRPAGIPGYILKRYQQPYLVPQVMLLFSNQFNKTDYSDQTALAEMIYYGKSYYFAKHTVPCAPDSLFTGYTAEETKDINDHEQVIWASLLENQMLYTTSQPMKDKFLSERPKTLEIGEKCPGRIGRWIGWRIVNKYMEEHPDVQLPQLMKITDTQKIFTESKYKPVPY